MDKELFKKSLFDLINHYVVAAVDLNSKMIAFDKTKNETALGLTEGQIIGLNNRFKGEVDNLINILYSPLVAEDFTNGDEEDAIVEMI